MYPSKSVSDYMMEFERLFPKNDENGMEQQANTSTFTLFNQSATNISSSTDSTSPESYSDMSIQFPDSEYSLFPRHHYREPRHIDSDIQSTHGYRNELYDSPIACSKNYQQRAVTSPISSISQWSDYEQKNSTSPKWDYKEFVPSQHLYSNESPVATPTWHDFESETWSVYKSPITTKNWTIPDSPIRRQRPIVGRKLMINESKQTSQPNKFVPAIWTDETSSNIYEQKVQSPSATYQLFPVEKTAFDVKSNISSVSPKSNVGHASQSVLPNFSIPLVQPMPITGQKLCTFCRKNGETPSVYLTHNVKERVKNKQIVSCPILRSHVCSMCGKSGDMAHTITYCPVLRSSNNGEPLPSTTITLKNTRIQSNGKRRY